MQRLLILGVIVLSSLLYTAAAQAETHPFSDFTVKENLSQNGKLAIIAIDPNAKADNAIQGNYEFTINGFSQTLHFTDGVAVTQQALGSSSFVFFKLDDQAKPISHIFFLRKTDQGIKAYKVNGWLLIIVPLVILYIAYKLKRFIITLVILALIYFYMNQSKGLEISQIIDGILNSVKSLI